MIFYPIIIVLICFAVGMPVAFAMIIACLPYFINDQYATGLMVIQQLIGGAESFSLAAIPFFIVAGSIMNYSGITEKLMALADALVGHFTGGLGHVNILLSTMMGGISGSGAADAASDCKILVPEMTKHGYPTEYAAAVTAASACITPIIPPGVGLVVYACVMEISVGKLFSAGYIPGAMMCIGMLLANYFISKKRGYKANRDHMVPIKQIIGLALSSLWALLLPFGFILALRVGVCTPTEGGALMALYSLIVGRFIYKKLEWKNLPAIMLDGALSTASVMLIMAAANVLSHYMSWERIPYLLTGFIIDAAPSRALFLALSMLLLLVMGMFMDGIAAMIIIAPLLAPVGTELGVNMLHFGLIMVLNCAIGAITPPFGNYLFLVSGTLHCSLTKVVKEILPYIGVCLVVLVLCTYIPDIVLIVPKLLYGSV